MTAQYAIYAIGAKIIGGCCEVKAMRDSYHLDKVCGWQYSDGSIQKKVERKRRRRSLTSSQFLIEREIIKLNDWN